MSTNESSVRPLLEQWAWLRNVARREAFDTAGADDLMQDVVLRYLHNPPKKQGVPSLRAWVATVIRRIRLDRARGDIRREARERRVAAGPDARTSAVDAAMWNQAADARLHAAVSGLREPYRTAVRLRYFEGMTASEIASRGDHSPAAVRQHVHRGLKVLRAELDDAQSLDLNEGYLSMGAAGAAWILTRVLRVRSRPLLATVGGALASASVALWLLGGPSARSGESLALLASQEPALGGPDQTEVDLARTEHAPFGAFGAATAIQTQPAANEPASFAAPRSITPSRGQAFGGLEPNDHFGRSLAGLGDLDDDGSLEFLVGADGDASETGSVWILSIDAGGALVDQVKIGPGSAGFDDESLAGPELFGYSVANIGDLDGDGLPELAVGAPWHELTANSPHEGAVWILFLERTSGSLAVRSTTRISPADDADTFEWTPGLADNFGSAVTGIGDVDGDGIPDLAIGAHEANAGRGEVVIAFLNADGTCRSTTRIGHGVGGLGSVLLPQDHFGRALAGPGDIDRNGTPDLAVGAVGDDAAGPSDGAIWVLLLRSNGRVLAARHILPNELPVTAAAEVTLRFGASLSSAGDLTGDGVPDLVTGSRLGTFVLALRRDGSPWAITQPVWSGECAIRNITPGTLDILTGRPHNNGERGALWAHTLPLALTELEPRR